MNSPKKVTLGELKTENQSKEHNKGQATSSINENRDQSINVAIKTETNNDGQNGATKLQTVKQEISVRKAFELEPSPVVGKIVSQALENNVSYMNQF